MSDKNVRSATAEIQPDARMTYSSGDYEHAVRCYYHAKEWLLNNGLATRADLCGNIFAPAHPFSPTDSKIVPPNLLNLPGWTVTVTFFGSENALSYLQTVPLPKGATLQILSK